MILLLDLLRSLMVMRFSITDRDSLKLSSDVILAMMFLLMVSRGRIELPLLLRVKENGLPRRVPDIILVPRVGIEPTVIGFEGLGRPSGRGELVLLKRIKLFHQAS